MPITTSPVLRADDGDLVHLFDLGVRFMIDGATTGGAFSLVEHPLPPRALGAPIHTHELEDEYSYILEGEIGLLVGEEVVVAQPGELVFKPCGIPHTFWNAGDEPARLLETISPAGFEQYFRDLAPLLDTAQPDMAAVGAVAARYRLDVQWDSIPMLAQRFGLRVG